MLGFKIFLPTTGATGKQVFFFVGVWKSIELGRRCPCLERVCAEKVCTDFLAPERERETITIKVGPPRASLGGYKRGFYDRRSALQVQECVPADPLETPRATLPWTRPLSVTLTGTRDLCRWSVGSQNYRTCALKGSGIGRKMRVKLF